MKSTLRIAAAGACLSVFSFSPALAATATSSSVQLYGLVDTGLQYLSNGPSGNSKTGMSTGNLSGSRWGLRGTEDLGDDLSTVFVLENGFDSGNGTTMQGGRLFGRQAYVGLSSKSLGRLTLGRHNTLMIDWMSKYNPFDNANFSIKRPDAAFSDRTDNAVMYVGKFGPVSVGGYYSFGWNNEQSFDDKTLGRMLGGGVRYQSGGLDAGLLYHSKHADKPAKGANSDNREDRIVAGLSYDFEGVKVYAGYRWLEQKLTQRTYKNNLTWLGVTYLPVQNNRLSLAVYHLNDSVCDDMNNAVCPAAQAAGTGQKSTMFVLGNEYDLSKRTTVYAVAAYAVNDDKSAQSVVGGKYGANVEPGKNQFGLNLGLRHRF
ncbi:Outer membrane porin protein BP0840 precursor [Achromobacter xylosoxidans]|uniref:porin n=1 Tax=Alcaligenes xylosoxydans xylosoxydans TaxID=85698 RepID=UPI0006C66221|nr:porin [Achromobacter xylosoxidans]CUI37738.1 Outer membrane porin protein BP0840 precursor [Achromobacter xylosoxidans]CUJ87005.1 Outer membrane porin protein BP0840 precursor [Achromobacter xylosoxidans]